MKLLNFFKPRPGAALLLTLLIVVGISGVILTSTKLVLESSRVVATQEDSALAEQAARAGIDVGLATAFIAPASYEFSPVSYGFTSGALTCDTLVAGSGTSGCPSFSITGTDLYQAAKFTTLLSNADLPLNIPVTFSVKSGTGFLTINGDASLQLSCSSDDPNACNPLITYTNAQRILITPNTHTLTFTRKAGTMYVSGAAYQGIANETTGTFTLQRQNYVCIASTGYSGTVQKKMRAIIINPTAVPKPKPSILEGFDCNDRLF